MRSLLIRLSTSFTAFFVGVGVSVFCHALFVHQTIRPGPTPNQVKQICSPDKAVAEDADVSVTGRYSNFDYAYSALVPKGRMAAMNSNPPNPNHGFYVDLVHPTSTASTIPTVSLWADANYDSAEYKSPTVVIRNNLEWLRERHSKVRLLSKSPTHLASLRAVGFVITYEDAGEAMIEDQIVAFRSQLGEESDIVYTIDLRTTASRFNQDKQLLVEMQRSWIIDPLPNEYPLSSVDWHDKGNR